MQMVFQTVCCPRASFQGVAQKLEATTTRNCLVAMLLSFCFLAMNLKSQAGTLDVTRFGARGDAASIMANTVAGSTMITISATNALSSADVGKLMLLFGAGPATSPTNHQDLIATIQRVDRGTNITLSAAAGATSNNVTCTYGTQNSEAFQSCVDAAIGTNTVIVIPAGNYLMVPSRQVTGFAMKDGGGPVASAVVIRKGGIDFEGDGMAQTILTGCGAWKLQGRFAHRGWLFVCQGPISSNFPLVFENLTMDGGVLEGNTSQHGFPASARDGSGWDETHDAVVDTGRAPLHQVKVFRNCRFTHWRGEILKSVTGDCSFDGFILVTNCVFDDGNASGFNFTFSHDITGCTFSNLFQVLEFYQAYCSNACYFRHNTVTNITGTGIALCGALTNRPPAAYLIQSNRFSYPHFAVLTTPAQNVSVNGNVFIGVNGSAALGLGCAGYQGSAINRNILVVNNDFKGSYGAIDILGSDRNRIADVRVLNNTATGVGRFASGYGWSTNVWFHGNTADAGLWEVELKGQWFLDDASNAFPPWTVNGSVGRTNIITYARGMRQRLVIVNAGVVFALDDSQPDKIPAGARLQATSVGKFAATLYLSTTRPGGGSPILLQSNDTVTFDWMNGEWQEQAPKS